MNAIKTMLIFKIMRILYLKSVYDHHCSKISGYNSKIVFSLSIHFSNAVLGGTPSINQFIDESDNRWINHREVSLELWQNCCPVST